LIKLDDGEWLLSPQELLGRLGLGESGRNVVVTVDGDEVRILGVLLRSLRLLF
jgi:hypothetical protein